MKTYEKAYEKVPAKVYFEDQADNYVLGKKLEKSTTHINLDPTDSIISRYSKKHKMDFITIYKLYKLQNYHLNASYFDTSHYSSKTLQAMLSNIIMITNNKNLDIVKKRSNTLFNFIEEIKSSGSYPFPLISELPVNARSKKPTINSLLSSGVLTPKECQYITNGKKDEAKKVRRHYTNEQYEILVKNYNLSTAELRKLIPEMDTQTVRHYKNIVTGFASGVVNPHYHRLYNIYQGQIDVNNTENTIEKLDECSNINQWKYALLCDNKIMEGSLDYLSGYRTAVEHFSSTSCRLIRFVEL